MSVTRSTTTLEAERVIAFRPEIARLLGSINAAILYQQLTFWSDKGGRGDGLVYKTAREIEGETTLTEKQQRAARKILVDMGWLEVQLMKADGSPTLHFRCLIDVVTGIWPRGQMDSAQRPNGNGLEAKTINIEDNIEDNKEGKIVLSEQSAKPGKVDNRDPEVTEMIQYFEIAMDLKMPRPQYQRRAAKTLILRWGLPTALRAVDAVVASRDQKFAPRILSLEDLRDKWNKLTDFYKRTGSDMKKRQDALDEIKKVTGVE